MKTFIPAFLFFLISHSIIAQNQVIGAWREHLPYNRAKMVADAGSKIYCATADGLFSYIKDDGNLERFSKLNGLNDFGISAIAYNNTYHVLIIAYSNANIDLLYDDHSVYNLSFIKDKSITGNKNINNIYIKGKYAYMACGFGIVVLDIERQEVKETYIIGANGSNINIWDVTDDGNKIYAATDSSVLTASLTGSNLADFNNWSIILKDTGNAGDFNIIRFFGNKIYVNYAKPYAVSTQTDELWKLEGGNWTLVNQPDLQQQPKRYSMKVVNDELIITNNNSVSVYDTSFQRTDYFDNNAYPNPQMRDAFFENNDIVWIADFAKGLIKIENSGATTMIFPRGPFSSYTADIAIKNKKLWVAHGPRSASWNPQEYPIDGFSFYNNGEWQSWNKLNTPELITNSFNSNMSLSIYPGQDEHIRVGSVTNGLLDFNKNSGFTFYNKNNSTLQPAVGNEAETIVHGIVHDDDGNLWVVNSGVQNVIHVLKTDGIWRTFDMTGVVSGSPFAGSILIDQNNFKWVNLFGGQGITTYGLLVLDERGTVDDTADDRKKFIAMAAASIPRCMAMDQDGQIWVGTDKGPQIIYSPAAAFDGSAAPQQILIKQDNTYQYLLELETVTAIAVDGANRKWMGTVNSGVYLFSPDGLNEIHHYTVENSPLFSNNISCITIDPQSGEVFIGTDKGMISYQSDAIEGTDSCNTVIVYPNPVRPGYDGPIAIKGVMNNAKIKITDIGGNVVYEGAALGGQAIWNGQSLKGEKAHTGVYLVFASDNAGTNACITKLLFIK